MSFLYKLCDTQQVLSLSTKQKLLNKIYFNKALIRSNLLNHKKLKVLDSYNNFSIIENSLLPKNDSSCFLGQGLNTQNIIYSSTLNKALKFQIGRPSFTGEHTKILATLAHSLEILYNNENKVKNLLILNPIKGGFNCYSSGFFGFLPRGQANIFFHELSINIVNHYKKNSLSSVFSFFRTSSFTDNQFILRMPLYIGKMSIFPIYKRNNFSMMKRTKKRTFNNILNLVFLAQPEESENTSKNLSKNEKNQTIIK